MLARFVAFAALLSAPALAEPAIGERSPELGIEELLNAPEGAEATLDALKGKFVVLEFWATWCGPCVGAIPHLNGLHEAYKDRFVFVSVTDEDRATVEDFQEDKPVIANWIGIDADRSLFEAYGVRGIPRTVVLDHNGRVVFKGGPHQLTPEQLDAFLDGERQTERRPLGNPGDTMRDRALAAFSGVSFAGRDPVQGLDQPPRMQFILRPAAVKDDSIPQIALKIGDRISALRIGRDSVIRHFYNVPASLLDLSSLEPSEEEYDLIIGGDFPIDDARRLALHAFDAEEHREVRTVRAYRLVLDGASLRGTSEPMPGTDARASFEDGTARFIDSQMTLGLLAEFVEGWTGVPCENGIDSDVRLKLDLTIPTKAEPELIAALLEEAHGITLEPFETEREVVVIRPADRAAARD